MPLPLLAAQQLLQHQRQHADSFLNIHSLWLQKLTLLDLNIRLIRHNRFENAIIRTYLVVFFISYVAAQVMTFAECRPFHLYWEVVPSPGMCLALNEASYLLMIPMPLKRGYTSSIYEDEHL